MRKFLGLLIIIIFCLFLYGMYIEPNYLNVKEYSIYNDNLPVGFDGFKVLQFSDLRYDGNINMLDNIVKEANNINPDILIFSGDLLKEKINNKDKKEIIKKLQSIKVNLYKFYIKGEIDNNTSLDILKQSGFIYLNNSSKLLFNNGNTPILIAGGDNLTKEDYKQDVTSKYNIILIHKPDNYDNIDLPNGYNLVLASHSLGGQARLPFFGSIINKKGAVKYTDEYYNYQNKDLYINFGIGTGKFNFRLFNKPEITLYRLYSK